MRVRWRRGPLHVRLFHVHGIKFAVLRVAGIKGDGNDSRRVARVGHKLRKNVGEMEVRVNFFVALSRMYKRAALIVDEETRGRQRSIGGLRAHGSHAAQLTLEINVRGSFPAVSRARERRTRIILQQDRCSVLADLGFRGVLRERDGYAAKQPSNAIAKRNLPGHMGIMRVRIIVHTSHFHSLISGSYFFSSSSMSAGTISNRSPTMP